MNEFTKSHGLGNDYIVLVQSKLSFQLNPDAVKLICDRHYGVGSDGILLLCPSEKSDFGLKIFNPDGSEAEKSGNGLRIFSKFLFEHGYTNETNFSIDTRGGKVRAQLHLDDDKVKAVTVDMGKASFVSSQIPVAGDGREVVGEELVVDDKKFKITAVSVGNPHCVIFSDKLDIDELRHWGPKLENHPSFPNRINVQMAKVESRDRVSILIWERGAGYTLASGSSSCAVAAACVKNGLTNNSVTVQMPGGGLEIEVAENWEIRMTGPVEEICAGTLSDELLRKITES